MQYNNIMKEKFKNWLIQKEYTENTANSYSSGINQISKDLSKKMQTNIDIYKIEDLFIIAKFSELYDKTGGFSEFGDTGNGTVRCAIRKYFEFLIER